MQHTIENSDNTLTRLLQQVQDQAARSQDFLAPTNQLQLMTGDRGDGSKVSQIIMEQSGGAPTQILAANEVAFDRSASGPVSTFGLLAGYSRITPPSLMD